MKTSELIKLLKRAKYRRIRNGSRHDIWYSPMTNREFPVTIFPFFLCLFSGKLSFFHLYYIHSPIMASLLSDIHTLACYRRFYNLPWRSKCGTIRKTVQEEL